MYAAEDVCSPTTEQITSLQSHFLKPISMLAELADCGGCMIEANDVGGHPTLHIYIPSNPEVLTSVVNVLSHCNVEWDNLLVNKINDFDKYGVATIPHSVCRAIAAALSKYVQPEFSIDDAINHLFAHLLATFTHQVEGISLSERMVEQFIKCFCQRCKDSYFKYRSSETIGIRKKSEQEVHLTRQLLVFKRCPSSTKSSVSEHEVTTILFELGPPMDICKLLCDFLDSQRGVCKGEEAKSRRQADWEWLTLLYNVLRANLGLLWSFWSEHVLDDNERNLCAQMKVCKYPQLAGGPPPLLRQHLTDLVLLARPTLLRYDVSKLVRSVLETKQRPRFTKRNQTGTPCYENRRVALNGKLRGGPSVRILAVNAPDGDVLCKIPSIASFGETAKFVSGFVQRSGLGSTSVPAGGSCTRLCVILGAEITTFRTGEWVFWSWEEQQLEISEATRASVHDRA